VEACGRNSSHTAGVTKTKFYTMEEPTPRMLFLLLFPTPPLWAGHEMSVRLSPSLVDATPPTPLGLQKQNFTQ
jgi:hypothetical protein